MSYSSPNAWRAAQGYSEYEEPSTSNPEELAANYADKFYPLEKFPPGMRGNIRRAFLAGWSAARERYTD